MWSGHQKGRPHIHDGEAKQKYNSHVEILNLITGNWRQCPTTGNPPLSLGGYASAVIDNNIIYFGGYCGHKGCYHNNVSVLCVDTLTWKELSPTNPHTGPWMKCGCSMIPVKIDGKNYLLVIGGRGPSVNTPQQENAWYSDKGLGSSLVRTNEQHYFNLSTGEYTSVIPLNICSVYTNTFIHTSLHYLGEWISPNIRGNCPPPCDFFPLTSLTDNTFVMFGGRTADGQTNATYIGHCTKFNNSKYTCKWVCILPITL